jgi:single-strand DNA-binding protein
MYQKLTLVGNVGKDAEMRYSPTGLAITSFSMATNNSYTNHAGEKVKETTWLRVTTWGKQAEVTNQYVKKGMTILVEGTLTADKVTGGPRVYKKQDGTFAASFEINASTVRFLSHKETQQEENGAMPAEEDIPF